MSTIKTTVRNRRIELVAPDELPDGTEVLVELTAVAQQRIGIDESEWRDDPAALADWEAWIKAIEPIDLPTTTCRQCRGSRSRTGQRAERHEAKSSAIITSGPTLAGAFANACEALDLHLERIQKLGKRLPKPRHALVVQGA
jgi:hypothetical protein